MKTPKASSNIPGIPNHFLIRNVVASLKAKGAIPSASKFMLNPPFIRSLEQRSLVDNYAAYAFLQLPDIGDRLSKLYGPDPLTNLHRKVGFCLRNDSLEEELNVIFHEWQDLQVGQETGSLTQEISTKIYLAEYAKAIVEVFNERMYFFSDEKFIYDIGEDSYHDASAINGLFGFLTLASYMLTGDELWIGFALVFAASLTATLVSYRVSGLLPSREEGQLRRYIEETLHSGDVHKAQVQLRIAKTILKNAPDIVASSADVDPSSLDQVRAKEKYRLTMVASMRNLLSLGQGYDALNRSSAYLAGRAKDGLEVDSEISLLQLRAHLRLGFLNKFSQENVAEIFGAQSIQAAMVEWLPDLPMRIPRANKYSLSRTIHNHYKDKLNTSLHDCSEHMLWSRTLDLSWSVFREGHIIFVPEYNITDKRALLISKLLEWKPVPLADFDLATLKQLYQLTIKAAQNQKSMRHYEAALENAWLAAGAMLLISKMEDEAKADMNVEELLQGARTLANEMYAKVTVLATPIGLDDTVGALSIADDDEAGAFAVTLK